MAPTAAISRSLLNSKSLHVRSSICTLGRGLGRTSTTITEGEFTPFGFQRGIKSYLHHSRQHNTVKPGHVLRHKEQLGLSQIASSNRRGLASQTEVGVAGYSDITEGTSNPSVTLVDDERIQLGDAKGKTIVLDRHWLRDACECDICVDPDSGQKKFGTCDVPTKLPIPEISRSEDGGLEVVWGDDFLTSGNHASRYSAPKVASWFDGVARYPLPTLTLWDKAAFEQDNIKIDFNEWMAGEQGFLSGLHRLRTHGLVFLKNVPQSEESVVSIANQIGNLQETFYGRTWDVRSKPKAENIAYTNSFLSLHQDLMYLRDPPRIQLLHCLENTCEGGESIFSDGIRAGHLIKNGPEKWFSVLSQRYVRYRYEKHGHYYQRSQLVLPKGLNDVFWSPPFQASEQYLHKTKKGSNWYRLWLEAATKFRQLVEEEQWMYQYKMQPGECVIFDNLRVLHGRKEFDNASGSRWLKGTYISNDVFRSKLAMLSKQLLALGEGNERGLDAQAKMLQEKYGIWKESSKDQPPSQDA
ncbi:Clavaminate synthase-like protein [Hypoxylon fuscum]|nr:Clavaminate synthase-like protein [Hypoxylon fuscum]